MGYSRPLRSLFLTYLVISGGNAHPRSKEAFYKQGNPTSRIVGTAATMIPSQQIPMATSSHPTRSSSNLAPDGAVNGKTKLGGMFSAVNYRGVPWLNVLCYGKYISLGLAKFFSAFTPPPNECICDGGLLDTHVLH